MYLKSSILTTILLNWNDEMSSFAVVETKPTAMLSVSAEGKSYLLEQFTPVMFAALEVQGLTG